MSRCKSGLGIVVLLFDDAVEADGRGIQFIHDVLPGLDTKSPAAMFGVAKIETDECKPLVIPNRRHRGDRDPVQLSDEESKWIGCPEAVGIRETEIPTFRQSPIDSRVEFDALPCDGLRTFLVAAPVLST